MPTSFNCFVEGNLCSVLLGGGIMAQTFGNSNHLFLLPNPKLSKMKKLMIVLVVAALWSCTKPQPAVQEAVMAPTPAMEFADAKLSDICKQGLAGLSSGDIDSFVSAYADNVMYRFNNGDSIVGKAAVTAYWKDRRTNVIDKITFTNDIYLPIKVNESKLVQTGNWVLAWFNTSATYKATGKSMSQSIHNLYHFDANSKIDLVVQYMDRAPIMAAMKK